MEFDHSFLKLFVVSDFLEALKNVVFETLYVGVLEQNLLSDGLGL